ncbi:ankyrin repeat protein [Seiridium cupressi]
MAEVGTILAIVQIADRVIGLCKYWIEAIRDAPSDLRSILLETSMLQTIFKNIEFLITCGDALSTTISDMLDPNGAIEHCRKTLMELTNLIPLEDVFAAHNSMSRTMMLARLAWPFRENKARKLLQELGRYKAAIGLALTTQSAQDIQQVKTNTEQMLSMLSDNQRHEFYRWLQRTDPSSLHNRALSLVEDGTCTWILRSPDWDDWLAKRYRSIWLHGIPGAGKTILASYLVDRVKDHCKKATTSKLAFAYYYCYFGHNQDEAAPFLRWLVTQLCRQLKAIPTYAYNLFEQGFEPSLPELLTCLSKSLECFDTAYIIIDAVDESKPRDDLLKVIRDLACDARFHNLQILATSRDKFKSWPQQLLTEAEEALSGGAKGMFRWAVCQLDRLQRFRGEAQAVRKALATLPKTLDETYERIFLEIPEEEKPLVRKCLGWIDFHHKVYGVSVPCSIVVQAIDSAIAELSLDVTWTSVDEENLRETCGCLIRIADDRGFETDTWNGVMPDVPAVSFAHYTVREILGSERISASAVSYFALEEDKVQRNILAQVLRNALDFASLEYIDKTIHSESLGIDQILFKELVGNFYLYCAISAMVLLPICADKISSHPDLIDIIFRLISPPESHYNSVMKLLKYFENGLSLLTENPNWHRIHSHYYWTLVWDANSQSTTSDAMILFEILLIAGPGSKLTEEFVKNTARAVDMFYTPLAFTIKMQEAMGDHRAVTICYKGSMVEFFAQNEICAGHLCLKFILDQMQRLSNPNAVLYFFVGSSDPFMDPTEDQDYLIPRIIELGADPNCYGYATTPLQIAVENRHYRGVDILL